jgi:peptidoglycan-associated lipoprotein
VFGIFSVFVVELLLFMGCSTTPTPKPQEATIQSQEQAAVSKPAKETISSSGSSLEAHIEGKSPASGPLKDIYFDFDRYDLRSDARDTLKAHAGWLKDKTSAQVQIEGHCDERGTGEYNLAWSEARPSG